MFGLKTVCWGTIYETKTTVVHVTLECSPRGLEVIGNFAGPCSSKNANDFGHNLVTDQGNITQIFTYQNSKAGEHISSSIPA